MKFKKGDNIVVTQYGNGFESATVTGTIEKKGKQYYILKIPCGIAFLPIEAEYNYELKNSDE